MSHIMVVQDEPALLSIVRIVLEKQGHKVSSVPNGAEALKALGVEPFNISAELPDLIVMDIMSPVLDSRTVALSLKDSFRTRNIPLLILAAKCDMRGSLSDIPSVAGFLDRRLNPKLLAETVARILHGSSSPTRPSSRPRVPEFTPIQAFVMRRLMPNVSNP